MRCFAIVLSAALVGLASVRAEPPKPEKFDDAGFVTLFNGKDLTGWKVSAKTGHSNTSKNTSGGKWEVKDGAITGSQDVPGNGGIVITEKEYADFEVVLEMNNDFGPDSGLFLRSTDTGKCYQAMIDYHANGNLMGVYGEGIGGKPNVLNFSFKKAVTEIEAKEYKPFPCPVSPADWPKFWTTSFLNENPNPSEREVRIGLEGNLCRCTGYHNIVKAVLAAAGAPQGASR